MAKTLKRTLAIVIVFTFLLTGCQKKSTDLKNPVKEKENTKMIVSLLVDSFGLEDGSINSQAYQGLKDLKVDTGIDIEYEVAESDDKFLDTIDKLVEDGSKLIWGAGYQTSDAIKEASYKYKEINFASLDNPFDESSMPKNLTGTIFKTEESSYLLGYITGYMTKTNKVAYLGGDKGVLTEKNEYGFRAGVLDASKERKMNISLSVQYIGNFSDENKGRIMATSIFDSDVDIIYADAGGANLGAIQAAKEQDKFLVVNEEGLIKLAPKNILISSKKNYSEVLNSLSYRFIGKDQIGGRNYELGLRDNALGLSDFDEESGLVTKAVYDKAINKKKEIAKASKTIPFNEASFKKYTSMK